MFVSTYKVRITGFLAALIAVLGFILLDATRGPIAQASTARPRLVFNIYSQQQTQYLLSKASSIWRSDTFVIVSGNNGNPLSTTFVNKQASLLRSKFSSNPIYVYTAGTVNPNNVSSAAASISSAVSGVIYGYEPSMVNEPEFSWTFSKTLANVTSAAKAARSHGKKAGVAPTGRPLQESGLTSYRWDYGQIMRQEDFMIVQTQTWAHKSLSSYVSAINTLKRQITVGTWCPQFTIDTVDGNGISASAAYSRYRAAPTPMLALWTAPSQQYMLGQFLNLIR